MREIKFRAWDKKHKHFFDVKEFGNDGSNCWASSKRGGYRHWNPIFVQYTGLKDKNGREIYEGDCYTAKHKSGKVYTGQVKYDLSFVFDIEGFEESFINGVGAVKTNRTFDIHSFVKWFGEVEVIGNIYEDPQLLEAAE
ncbi:YopX family protein [Bacillus vallismortis]|uniref:YopX family protein n=1 Tax=Bacillus vallismortis TaxID=72361 RepID=UPI00227DC0CE|nr:YopX family protein [Bacillus vallismortis]MCY7919521.1 YopX family protein [Bacillus vallismortis]